MSDLERVGKAYLSSKKKKNVKDVTAERFYIKPDMDKVQEKRNKDYEEAIDRIMKTNSREQWLQNRAAGDTTALEMSYDEWKKL